MSFLSYLLLCVVSALLAKDTRLGFFLTFVVAFFFTPIPVFLGLYAFRPVAPPAGTTAATTSPAT